MKKLYLGIFLWIGVMLWVLFPSTTFADGTIDTSKVQSTWLQRTNTLRKDMKLSPYTIDTKLTTTATERSTTAKNRGYISHERKKGDGYYNYSKIEKWFADRGLKFQNVKKTTFSESIGWGYISCPHDGDCTDTLIKATKSTWNFYMAEQGKKSQSHYKALTHKYFTTMGVGVTVDEKMKRYYITIHYGTKILEKQ